MAQRGDDASERGTPRVSHDGAPRARPSIPKIGRGQPSARCSETAPPEVARGLEQFNLGQFFDQHETLEAAWIPETDPIRYLYQGILQVGVGLYHLQRGNLYGAQRLLARGLVLLEPFRPGCMGVDVERFFVESRLCLDAIAALTQETLHSFDRSLIPQVRYMV